MKHVKQSEKKGRHYLFNKLCCSATTSLFVILGLCLTLNAEAQRINSSCEAPDSILSIYERDAALLALVRMDQIGQNAVLPDTDIKDSILSALIAVYNAVGLPGREAVTRLYNIKVNNYQYPEALVVQLDASLELNTELGLAEFLSEIDGLSNLSNAYGLELVNVVDETTHFTAHFKLNEIVNIDALTNLIDSVTGVKVVARQVAAGNDYSDIFYVSYREYTELVYSYSWGNCPLNCQNEHNWRFKIYPDCSVEFVGDTGDPLIINELAHLINVGIYPNPTVDFVNVNLVSAPLQNMEVQLYSTSGILLYTEKMPVGSGLLNLSFSLKELPQGIYLLAFRTDRAQLTEKIFKR